MASLKEIHTKIQKTKKSADEAKKQAETASNVPVGFWKRDAPALEALQRTEKSQSEALINITECQELLFYQQFVLAQCSKYLFLLCCANLAGTRAAVREIQLRLKGASEGEISEVAKNELQKTLQQLKQQLDILEQNERMKNKFAMLENNIGVFRKDIESRFQKSENDHVLKEQDILEQNKSMKNKVAMLEKHIGVFCKDIETKFKKSENGHVLKEMKTIYGILFVFFLLLVLCGTGLVFFLVNQSH